MEAERARLETDVPGLIAEAIRAKEAERVKLSEREETPFGERLTWHTTAEEIARINAGEREALDAFYFEPDNYRHLQACARSFFRRVPLFPPYHIGRRFDAAALLRFADGIIKIPTV